MAVRRRQPRAQEPEAFELELEGDLLPEDYMSSLWAIADIAWPSWQPTAELLAWARLNAPGYVLSDEDARSNRDRRLALEHRIAGRQAARKARA